MPNRWVAGFANAWVELFRNIPLLVQIFFMFYVLPRFGISLSPFLTGVIAGLAVGEWRLHARHQSAQRNENESDADAFAYRSLKEAGQSTAGLATLFEKLLKLELGESYNPAAVQPMCPCTTHGHDEVRRREEETTRTQTPVVDQVTTTPPAQSER